MPKQLPADLNHRGGLEASTRDILLAAWRGYRRDLRRGIAVTAAALALALVATAIVVCTCPLTFALLSSFFSESLAIRATAVLAFAAYVTSLFVWAVMCDGPLSGAWWLAVSRTYDGRRMSLRGLLRDLRQRKSLFLWLGAIEAMAMGPAFVIVWLLFSSFLYYHHAVFESNGFLHLLVTNRVNYAFVFASPAFWTLELIGLAAVRFFFYLVPLFLAADKAATECRTIVTNLRVLRSRPGAFLTVFLLSTCGWAVWVLMMTAVAALAQNASEHWATALWIVVDAALLAVGVWWALLSAYLKVALFRGTCGYGLDLK